MNLEEILTLKTGKNVELKSGCGGMPKSIYETYCSFANTSGGIIVVGVIEKGGKVINIDGVKDSHQLIKSFFDTLNNPSKVSLNVLDDSNIEIIPSNNGDIIVIHVPEADRGYKPIFLNNNISMAYKRNFEGDYKVNQNELISMINDHYDTSNDVEINTKHYGFDQINIPTLKAFRNVFAKNDPNNLFSNLNDYDFCVQTGILRLDKDLHYYLTNAGVLFFTNNILITSIYPNYFLDYKENYTNNERWDYRISSFDFSFSGNLFDFYCLVFPRLITGIPNKFTNEGIVETSSLDIQDAIKEGFVNALSNCNFFLNNSIEINKTQDCILFKNSGRSIIGLEKMIIGGTSNPRNVEIMRYFRILKYSQRSGYGVPNIFNIFKKNGLSKPMLREEDNPEKTILELIFTGNDVINLNKINSADVLGYMYGKYDGVTIKELTKFFSCDYRTIKEVLNYLLDKNKISTNNKNTKGKLYFLNNGKYDINRSANSD